MRDLLRNVRKFSVGKAFGVILGLGAGLLAFDQGAKAASLPELNFWLSGPRYDGHVRDCEAALGIIASRFAERESTFWNSNLQITAFGPVHQVAFRPWASDAIPRRFCTTKARLNDGKERRVNYSIIEGGGFAGYDDGVEWCVTGLDRNWSYNPACNAARP